MSLIPAWNMGNNTFLRRCVLKSLWRNESCRIFQESFIALQVTLNTAGRREYSMTRQAVSVCNNVTLRLVRVIIVAANNRWVLHTMRLCSLSYPACKATAHYYIVICGVSGSTIRLHIMVWYDIIWYGTVWYDMVYDICYDIFLMIY